MNIKKDEKCVNAVKHASRRSLKNAAHIICAGVLLGGGFFQQANCTQYLYLLTPY